MSDRNPLIPERIGPYYVYLLIDPRTGKPFYVGKGTGERFRSHGDVANRPVGDALLLADVGTSRIERANRLARIREIREAGLEYEVAFVRTRIPTEQEAYRVEAALIDSLDAYAATLVNQVGGHGRSDGLITLDELERELVTEPFTTQTPAILIKLFPWVDEVDPDTQRPGYGYKPNVGQAELLESVRAWWVLDSK
ncbi:MAG: GIY-YIG nuclease family protein, partial [Actinomycetota bacterium]|nr:GIY-YIG nuclease family protein [Actinomycetota bacterium]